MDGKIHQAIVEYLRSHDDVIRTSDFQSAGFHNKYLAELAEEGLIVRIKAGLYIAADAQTASGFFEVQLALPKGVICLGSALSHYELSAYEPPKVHVAIPRDDRTVPPEYPPVRRFSFGGPRYYVGVKRTVVDGRHVAIYDQEKTICDVVRYRRMIGQDVVNEALRNYLGTPGSDVDRVLAYSRDLGVEGPVETHLKLMT